MPPTPTQHRQCTLLLELTLTCFLGLKIFTPTHSCIHTHSCTHTHVHTHVPVAPFSSPHRVLLSSAHMGLPNPGKSSTGPGLCLFFPI